MASEGIMADKILSVSGKIQEPILKSYYRVGHCIKVGICAKSKPLSCQMVKFACVRMRHFSELTFYLFGILLY